MKPTVISSMLWKGLSLAEPKLIPNAAGPAVLGTCAGSSCRVHVPQFAGKRPVGVGQDGVGEEHRVSHAGREHHHIAAVSATRARPPISSAARAQILPSGPEPETGREGYHVAPYPGPPVPNPPSPNPPMPNPAIPNPPMPNPPMPNPASPNPGRPPAAGSSFRCAGDGNSNGADTGGAAPPVRPSGGAIPAAHGLGRRALNRRVFRRLELEPHFLGRHSSPGQGRNGNRCENGKDSSHKWSLAGGDATRANHIPQYGFWRLPALRLGTLIAANRH